MTIGKNDQLIPLRDVPKLIIELTGVSRTKATVYLWAKNGCRTIDGRRVKLETVWRLKQIFTTRQAVETFIREVG